MPLQLQTAASAPAVTLAEAKMHLRVITDPADTSARPEDALITALVASATLEVEHLMGRAVMPQQWQLTLDSFAPNSVQYGTYVPAQQSIDLKRPPVTSIVSIKYVDTTGALQTLLPAAYQLAAASDYIARVTPAYGLSWPAARAQPEAVQIIFATGYADATKVPEPIKTWIKLRVGTMYENRESVASDARIALIEFPFDCLLDRYRTWSL